MSPHTQQPSFFCQPGGNCSQWGGADSLWPLQFPFTRLHCPGGCAPAGDDVATNAAGKAAERASVKAQNFFFMGASLPVIPKFTIDYPLPVPNRQPRIARG